jgi:hypothetical protein
MNRRLLSVVAVAAALASATAFADERAACLDAAEKGQRFRDTHRLVEAREELRACAAAGCPAVVQTDCAEWLVDVERALPSVVLTAKSGAGADLVDVTVSVDGKPLASKLDGQAVPMNAGPHTFRFEAPDGTTAEEQVVVIEGEKNKSVSVTLLGRVAVAPAPSPAPASPVVASQDGLGTRRLVALIAGGAGVASLAVGSVFGLLTISEKNQQETDCPSPCLAAAHNLALGDHSTGITDGAVSTVAFIAGAALVAGGAVLFFTSGPSREQPAAVAVSVAPTAGPGGGGVLLRGEF